MVKSRHHAPDYAKNRTADVIMKDWGQADPNQQWEINLNPDMPTGNNGQGAFEPKQARLRPATHKKINECDH